MPTKKNISPSKRKKRWLTIAVREETDAQLNELSKFHNLPKGELVKKLVDKAFDEALKEVNTVN